MQHMERPDGPGTWVRVQVYTDRKAQTRREHPAQDRWPRWVWIRVA